VIHDESKANYEDFQHHIGTLLMVAWAAFHSILQFTYHKKGHQDYTKPRLAVRSAKCDRRSRSRSPSKFDRSLVQLITQKIDRSLVHRSFIRSEKKSKL
jgi:hypothetical protein